MKLDEGGEAWRRCFTCIACGKQLGLAFALVAPPVAVWLFKAAGFLVEVANRCVALLADVPVWRGLSPSALEVLLCLAIVATAFLIKRYSFQNATESEKGLILRPISGRTMSRRTRSIGSPASKNASASWPVQAWSRRRSRPARRIL